MKLKDLVLQYKGDGYGSQRIWTLDQGGATKQDYYYVNEAASETEGYDVGWYADKKGKVKADDVELPYGQGIALVAPSAETKLLFAGQVMTEQTLSMTGGGVFNFTGNCMPAGCTLGDLALIYKGDGYGSQRIWTLDQGGATKQDYYYVNESASETEGYDVGWYADKKGKVKANDLPLEAGDGFAVVAGSAVQLYIPSPIDEKK